MWGYDRALLLLNVYRQEELIVGTKKVRSQKDSLLTVLKLKINSYSFKKRVFSKQIKSEINDRIILELENPDNTRDHYSKMGKLIMKRTVKIDQLLI